jgi:hypothetical protein
MDRVRALCDGETLDGTVYVAPEQLLRPPETVIGSVLGVLPQRASDVGCHDLPGADMPPLGSRVRFDTLEGVVTGLDPLNRRMTVRTDQGDEIEDLTVPGDSAPAPRG